MTERDVKFEVVARPSGPRQLPSRVVTEPDVVAVLSTEKTGNAVRLSMGGKTKSTVIARYVRIVERMPGKRLRSRVVGDQLYLWVEPKPEPTEAEAPAKTEAE